MAFGLTHKSYTINKLYKIKSDFQKYVDRMDLVNVTAEYDMQEIIDSISKKINDAISRINSL